MTAALLKRRLSGVVFLLVVAGLIGLTIAVYQKVLVPVVNVTLEADRIGNQLTPPSDVKVRGLIVGEVRSVKATDSGAELELALDTEYVDLIPKDVRAQLLPKTLFGEKFVSLVVPADASDERIAEGDVIPQDRSITARETAAALNSLLPLLQTLNPEAVSTTLNAVSTALRGRGERVGSNLVLFRDYLEEFNPELPTLEQNFIGLADFADNLDAAAPDFLQVFDNSAFLGRSLVETEGSLNSFLVDTADVSRRFDSLLQENEQRFITLAADSRPVLETYARYSPEFPCLAEGLAISGQTIGDTFGGRQPGLHITLEFTEDQGSYRDDLDEPEYKDDRGPGCFGLERLPAKPDGEGMAADTNFLDGYRDDLGPGDTQPPEEEEQESSEESSPLPAAPVAAPASFLNTPSGQRTVLASVVAPVMGVSVDEVPDLAHLLFGPVARGTAVGLSSGRAS